MEGSNHASFVSLLLITVLALVVPVVVSRFRILSIPIVVGEIFAGIVIGESGFDLVQQTPTLKFLSEFGFSFLMFLSGLEVNFRMLFSSASTPGRAPFTQRPVPLAFLYLSATVALAVGLGLSLKWWGMTHSALLMGLILSTTSLGIVVPILKERQLTVTLYGQVVLVSALVSDFVTLLLLSLVIAVIQKGLSLDVLLFMVLLAAFAAAAKVGHSARRSGVFNRILEELSHTTSQIKVRGAFAMMVIWVVAAEVLGVELILGAFLAGAILSVSSRDPSSQLREKLDAIGYGFFIPIFFITVGAQFDIGALMDSKRALLLVPVLIGAAYAVKIIPALIFRSQFSWREVFAAGTLLSSRLSLIIAASAIALNLELITSAVNSAIILVAVVTCTFSPILFSKILPPVEGKVRKGVVILGTDQLAALLGQRLRKRGEEVTFIGRDQEQLELLRARGFGGIMGSPDDLDVLHAAGLENARALIALTNAPDVVVSVCRTAVQRYQVPTVIARLDDPQRSAELLAMGVRVVQPGMAVALALEGALHFPAAFGMLEDQEDDVQIGDVILRNESVAGNPLRKIRVPGNALVVGVRRRGEVMVPHGDTVLRIDDTLILVGSPEGLKEAARELGGCG